MSKVASILVCGLAASIFSLSAHAFPAPPAAQMASSDIIAVRGFCGLGFRRGPYGGCVPNGVPYGYVAPVVVAPPYPAAAVVAPRIACPYGYYYYAPYARCVPTP